MILRIATYNLQEGGGAGDESVLPSRWKQQIVMLGEWRLDLLLLQFTDRQRACVAPDLRLSRATHVNDGLPREVTPVVFGGAVAP